MTITSHVTVLPKASETHVLPKPWLGWSKSHQCTFSQNRSPEGHRPSFQASDVAKLSVHRSGGWLWPFSSCLIGMFPSSCQLWGS